MKAERTVKKGALIRALFCVALASALLISMFALNGFAAGSKPAPWNGKVVSCSTHTAALSPSGDLYLWGSNESGQFPDHDFTYTAEPVKVLSGVADVAVSSGRTLVVKKSGELVYYGREPATGEASAEAVSLAKDVDQVAAADQFAAYISKGGALYTWGLNTNGQLGTGSTETESAPVKIMEGVTQVDLGTSFALALKDDGTAYGWGADSLGEFGYKTLGSYPETVASPVKVMDGVKQVSAGALHSCFVKEDGTLWACGSNTYNQVGSDSAESSVGLTQILTDVASVSSGTAHNFAVGEDGTVYAWGSNLSGQLGISSTLQPTPVETDYDYTEIFVGGDNTFAVSSDGVISSWGENTNYLLGKSDGSNSLVPMKILDADMNWIYLTANEEQNGHNHGAAEPDAAEPDTANPSVTEPDAADPAVIHVPFVSGNGNGTFNPDAKVTRAEFVKMVVVACTDFDENTAYPASGFDDVVGSKWYAPYISYAKQNNLVNGDGTGFFRPDDSITRAEAAKITAAALDLTSSATTSSFKDVKAKWAIPGIEALAKEGILSGDAGTGLFRPNDSLTRAEAVKVVGGYGFNAKYGDNAGGLREKTEPVENPFSDVKESKWYYPYILYAAGKLS